MIQSPFDREQKTNYLFLFHIFNNNLGKKPHVAFLFISFFISTTAS